MPIKFLSKITGKDNTDQPVNISKIEGLVDPSTNKILLTRLPEIPPVMAAAEPVGTTTTAITTHENTTNHPLATQTGKGMMAGTDKAKLDGIAIQATKNVSDSELRDRSTHTGTQAIATVTGLQPALDGKQAAFAAQGAALFFGGPATGSAIPTFRTLAATDIPALDVAKITTGSLPITRGGTGSTTQNFVDLTTTQTAAGDKTFTGILKSNKYLLGSDLSLIPIVDGQSALSCWWGLQLIGNRQADINYTPANYGTRDDFGVIIPNQQASKIALVVQGAASQTGNLQSWRNSSGTVLAAIAASGALTLPSVPLDLNEGGTGARDATTARANLGIANITWNNLTLVNAWTGTVRYGKLSNGVVVIEGVLAKNARPTIGETIGTLPLGFRPSSGPIRFYVRDSAAASIPYVEISTAGVISWGNAGTISNTVNGFCISTISFYVG